MSKIDSFDLVSKGPDLTKMLKQSLKHKKINISGTIRNTVPNFIEKDY